MDEPNAVGGRVRAALRWLTALFWRVGRAFDWRRRPKLLASPKAAWDHVHELPEDLQVQLSAFSPVPGVVRDTVGRAIANFIDLRQIVFGPGEGGGLDVVDDAILLADAETRLRAIVTRAPDVQILVSVSVRSSDRRGRASAGDAVLRLRDDARVLEEVTSSAIQWAADRSDEAKAQLAAAAERLRL